MEAHDKPVDEKTLAAQEQESQPTGNAKVEHANVELGTESDVQSEQAPQEMEVDAESHPVDVKAAQQDKPVVRRYGRARAELEPNAEDEVNRPRQAAYTNNRNRPVLLVCDHLDAQLEHC